MPDRSMPTHTLKFEPASAHADPLDREWLLTNSDGGFAMGCVSGINARRYHGLLIGCTRPPVGRVVVLNQTLEQLVLPGASGKKTVVDLSSLDFESTVSPEGWRLVRGFSRGLSIQWELAFEGVRIVRELTLTESAAAGALTYTIERTTDSAPTTVNLRIAPLVSLRDFHQLIQKPNHPLQSRVEGAELIVSRPDGVSARFGCAGATIKPADEWWYQVFYRIEAQRGQDCREDLHLPAWFDAPLVFDKPGQAKRVRFDFKLGADPFSRQPAQPGREQRVAQVAQRLTPDTKRLFALGGIDQVAPERLASILALAADDFVVKRRVAQEELTTIIAGYPWFADWGRDTFIALPGLLLETGRWEEARSTLKVFARYIKSGLVPNVFDDYNDQAASYNTVDASLWYVHASICYVQTTGDREAWDQWLGQACKSILSAYIHGTEHEIRMAGDGLITAGNPGTQLTWMDAARDGVVFTPRNGKPVEINALWHHCLVGCAALLRDTDRQTAAHYDKLVSRAARTFLRLYWNDETGCLNDRVYLNEQGEEIADTLIRPNQVFAGSLENSPLPRTRQLRMLQTVREKLLTPFGLRTLAPDSPGYKGLYQGSPFERDGAYHQGTAWPWLLGPYAEAVLRAGRFSPESRKEAFNVIRPVIEQVLGGGNWPSIGQLWEVHSGDDNHTPGGCPAQAWSIAELLRLVRLIGAEPR